MASTFSGQGKRSRGAVHLQVGTTVGASACGRGDLTVTGGGHVLISCKACRRIFDREVALSASVIAEVIEEEVRNPLRTSEEKYAAEVADILANVRKIIRTYGKQEA